MNQQLKITATLVAVALGAIPAAALAQQAQGDTGWTMPYERGFWGHAGLSAGGAELDAECVSGFPCDRSDQAFRAFAGGRFNNAVGAEVGYIRFGDFRRGGGETDAEAFDLALIAGIPFANNWSVFGKVGGVYSEVDVTGPGVINGNEKDWGWRAGVGVQMGLTENWAVRADLDRFRLRMPGGGRENVDTLLVGAQYTFR